MAEVFVDQIPGQLDPAVVAQSRHWMMHQLGATIASAVGEQSASTKEIANNVNQAAQGIQEVNENVVQSSQVADGIAEDISQVKHASKEMSSGSSQVNVGGSADVNRNRNWATPTHGIVFSSERLTQPASLADIETFLRQCR